MPRPVHTLAAAAAAVVVLSGCPSSDTVDVAPPQPVSTAILDAEAAVGDTVVGYIATGNLIAAGGDAEHPWVGDYATPGAYRWLLEQVSHHAEYGWRFAGGVKLLSVTVSLTTTDTATVWSWLDVGAFAVLVNQEQTETGLIPSLCRQAVTDLTRTSQGWRVSGSDVFAPPTVNDPRPGPHCPDGGSL